MSARQSDDARQACWATDLVTLELLDHVVQQGIVKILASQEGISVCGLHLKHTTYRIVHPGDIMKFDCQW